MAENGRRLKGHRSRKAEAVRLSGASLRAFFNANVILRSLSNEPLVPHGCRPAGRTQAHAAPMSRRCIRHRKCRRSHRLHIGRESEPRWRL